MVRDTCINGPIWFAEGHNCRIAQDNGRNTITINAGEDLGAGQPCDEVPLTEDEMIESDSPFLTKGPGCKEIIQSINGIGGADITIRTGSGYRAQPDPDAPHRLIIARALSDFALCANEEIESSLSSSSLPSNDEIEGSLSSSSLPSNGPADAVGIAGHSTIPPMTIGSTFKVR